MEKSIFISDLDTELGYNLLKQYYVNGYQILGFSGIPVKELSLKDFNKEFIEIIEWNRNSPVGIKNLLFKGIAKFKMIGEAVLLQTVNPGSCNFTDLTFLAINKQVDLWIKGHLILLKELLSYFREHKQSILSLVNNIHYMDEHGASPLGEVLQAAFKAMVNSLFKTWKDSNIQINAFESSTCRHDKLSEYIYKTINEKSGKTSGKIFHFHDKRSLLNSFRNN